MVAKDPNFLINTVPDIPILGSSSSAANKDIVAKIWTSSQAKDSKVITNKVEFVSLACENEIWKNGDAIICLSRKHCGKRRNCSLRAISSFPTFSTAVCCRCVKMEKRVKGETTGFLYFMLFPQYILYSICLFGLDNTGLLVVGMNPLIDNKRTMMVPYRSSETT